MSERTEYLFPPKDNDPLKKKMDQLKEKFRDNYEEYYRFLMSCTEEILVAFVAKYRCGPDECVICQRTDEKGVVRIWIEKRNEGDKIHEPNRS